MFCPLVSIVVPVYNVQRYLPQCLDSLTSQTYANIEIICINDGSTDESGEIIKQYQRRDERIKSVTQINQGLSAARNAGLELAQGDLITFVDSDDWLDLNAIESVFEVFTDPEIDYCCFGSIERFERNNFSKNCYTYNQNIIREVDDSWIRSLGVSAWGKIYRTNFLKKYSLTFPEKLYYEDLYFHWGCVSYAKKIALFKASLYNYRIRDDSIMGESKAKKSGMAIHHIFQLERIHDLWTRNGFLNKHQHLFDFIFNEYVAQGYKYLPAVEKDLYIEEVKKCTQLWNLKLQRFTLSYDLVKGNQISLVKYRWVRSIRKRLAKLKNL